VSPFYRLEWENGYGFDYVNDQAELDRQIAAKSPADVEGYRRFLDYSKAVFDEGYLKLGAVPFLHFSDMVRVAPQLARLQAWRSVYSIVSRFIRDEELRQAFSFHSLLVGGNPFATSSIYALIHALERRWGVWFPRGGTGALIRGMVRLFEDIGGTIRLNAEVARIGVEGSRATDIVTKDGWRGTFDAVASNADVVHTYRKLLGESERGPAFAKTLERKRSSMSLFVIYFGLKRHRPELQHHTVLFGPRYRGLIDDIFNRETLADDFSLYLHSPCATDPSLAPPGAGAFYVLAPVPHLGTAPIDWDRMAPVYCDRILDYLEKRCIPGLREDLVTVRTFTPHDFRDELNAHVGSAFSLEPILRQSAWFRPHNRDDVIPNLYVVGAGTHPGAGGAGRGRFGEGNRRAHAGGCGAREAMTNPALVRAATETIAKGSKSFAVAAKLFGRETREGAVMLYAWCRYCDDVIDEQDLGRARAEGDLDERSPWDRLQSLEQQTLSALAGEPQSDIAFAALQAAAQRHAIPERLPDAAPRRVPHGPAGTPLRNDRGYARLLIPRCRGRRRDDGPYHGRTRPGRTRPCVRSRDRVPADEYRSRHRRDARSAGSICRGPGWPTPGFRRKRSGLRRTGPPSPASPTG
jgi:phytoene desaturase